MKTLHDILLNPVQLDSVFYDKVPVSLWRGQRESDRKKGKPAFRPILDANPKILPNGTERYDIRTEMKAGVVHVNIEQFPRGLSTFDRDNFFQGKGWSYIHIPEGTEIPPGLGIVKDKYNETFKAFHYTIAPRSSMPEEIYCWWLDVFTGNINKRIKELNQYAYGHNK